MDKREKHPLNLNKRLFKILQPACFFCPALYRLVRGSVFLLLFLSFFACATTPGVEDRKKAETHYNIGLSYLAKNQLRDAFVEFQKAIKLNPKNKEPLNALGLVSAEFKEYENAISYYKRALAIDPDYSGAMNNLGVTYVKTGNWDEAIKYFKMALKDPVYATPESAYSNMGYAYYKKGDYINATNTLEKTIEQYPGFPRPVYFLSLVHMKLGKVNEAIDGFKKAVDIDPKYMDAHWDLANAYLRIGDREKAFEHFRIIAESSVENKRREDALEYIELLKE